MGVLVWWLPPLIATVLAAAWLWWNSRPGTGGQGRISSPKQLRKMEAALNKQMPAAERTIDLRDSAKPQGRSEGRSEPRQRPDSTKADSGE